MVDTTREPKLAISEWNNLNTCERPCSNGGMERNDKKDQMGNLGGSRSHIPMGQGVEERRSERRGEDSGIEGRDNRKSSTATEGEAAVEAAFHDRQRSKRRESVDAKVEKGQDKGKSKGQDKGKPKGKNGAWIQNAHSKGGKESTQANEEKGHSQYTSYTSREQQWGVRKKQEAWGKMRWNDASNWEME